MYCYGSSFHASRLRLVIATPSAMMQQTRAIVASQTATVTRPITVTGSTILPSPNEKVMNDTVKDSPLVSLQTMKYLEERTTESGSVKIH